MVVRNDYVLGEVMFSLYDLISEASGTMRQFDLTKDFLPVLTIAGKTSYVRVTPVFDSAGIKTVSDCVTFPEAIPSDDLADKLVIAVRARNVAVSDWSGGSKSLFVGLFKQGLYKCIFIYIPSY